MATKNIVPRTDNEGQIGRGSKRWAQGNFVTGSFGLISGSLIPDVSGDKPAFNLGSSTHAWKELYVVTSSIKFIVIETISII